MAHVLTRPFYMERHIGCHIGSHTRDVRHIRDVRHTRNIRHIRDQFLKLSEMPKNNDYLGIFGHGFLTTKNNDYFGIFGTTFAKVSDVQNPSFLLVQFWLSKSIGQCQNTWKVKRPKVSGKCMALAITAIMIKHYWSFYHHRSPRRGMEKISGQPKGYTGLLKWNWMQTHGGAGN